MEFKFSKDSAGSQQEAGDSKGKQNVLLVLFLILVGVFAYIYLFTGLIKPLPEQKVAEAPAPSQMAKQPLPAPDGAPAKADGGAGEVKKDAAAPAVKPEPIQASPAAAAKPAVKEAKDEPKDAGAVLPAVKKPLPAAGKSGAKMPTPIEKKEPVAVASKAAQVEKKEPAPIASKPVTAPAPEKKPAEVKRPVEKPAAAAPAPVVAKAKKAPQKPVKKVAAAPAKVADSGKWTVLIGNYVLEEAMSNDLARVRKAGLEAYVVPGARKKTHMNRLLLAKYTDRDTAQLELAKLKRSTSDAFMTDSGGMHVVYAGSYLLTSRAASEKERLAAAGFTLTVKSADVSIPTKNLTAGSFTEKSAAEEVLKKLRSAGVKATLSRQ